VGERLAGEDVAVTWIDRGSWPNEGGLKLTLSPMPNDCGDHGIDHHKN
jgi:hypothetical protein